MKLAGKGKVFDGKDFIADVTYSVSMRKASQFAPADGQIHLEPDIGVYADRLTLETEDGWKWNFLSTGGGVYKVTGEPHR